jgi:tetratricopeptide (TPR) repeat protein
MPRARSISVLFVIALSLPLFCVSAPAAEKPPWIEVDSPHFTVITDAEEKKAREVAFRFEQMRAVFVGLLTKDHLNQPVPLTILAFKNDKMYYQLAPLVHVAGSAQGQPIASPGFFLAGDDQDFIVLNLFEEESWRAVAHDFAHMFLNYNYPPAQGWFDEGLCEYFSSIRVDNRQVEMGGDPELSGSLGQDLLGNELDKHPGKSLTELLQAQTWISLPDLFSMKHDSSGVNEGTHHTLYYAESWIVMHYLLHEKKMPETGTYFDLVLNRHLPVDEAIQKAYGMTAAQLEDAVKKYLHSLPQLETALDNARQVPSATPNAASATQPYQFTTPVALDDSVMTVKPYPEADFRALYAGVQIRIPERRDYGLQELKKLATTPTPTDIKSEARADARRQAEEKEKKERKDDDDNPAVLINSVGSALAHRILAWDDIEHGEFDDAIVELGDAAALNQRDMWVRYYLSILKYRMAQAKHADIAGLPNMLLDLRAVLEWYPEMAGAYDLLAQGRNEGGTPVPAMQAERAAINLSPRDERYTYHLALIYIASKKWDAAQAQLERLKNSSDPEIAKAARDKLEQAASERRYGIAGAAAMQPVLTPQKTPFDVLDEDAAKRAAEEKRAQEGTSDLRPTKFFKGRLLGVDCSSAPAAILTISAQGVVLKLRAVDYKSLLLIGADGFSCEWHDRQVTANYKPGGLSDGDLVSLEVR